MLTISDAAIALIIKEENSDEGYYNKLCRGFEWPGGASGPTCGIGYDCGYCGSDEIQADWEGLIPQAMIDTMKAGHGLTHERAHGWVRVHRRSIDISWAVACQQFKEREVPKWIKRTTDKLPNCELLAPDSLGALVSLAYNRGPSFRNGGDRCLEMRAIYNHMTEKDFAKIPAEFVRMQRLWPNSRGLRQRRVNEAALFKAGLSVMSAVA